MYKRALVLVIDGLGVGVMSDVEKTRPQDIGSHTLKHVIQASHIHFPNLKSLGAIDYFLEDHFVPTNFEGCFVSFGKFNLAHFGADSFLGHQEIAGAKPKKPVRQFVRNVKNKIIKHLNKEQIPCKFNGRYLEIYDDLVIADNIETDYGLNINVVGSLDNYSFEYISHVGKLVREVVRVGRVITMGGVGVTKQTLNDCFECKTRDGYIAWGINIPKLNIYNDQYRVVHLGYGINPTSQTPAILGLQGVPVVLIGKTADVINAPGAVYRSEVQTDIVLSHLLKSLEVLEHGFIFANVQQADLAGHEQNALKYAKCLKLVDEALPEIVQNLRPDDLLIITGDHGNDPTIGHSNHTREQTPLIMLSQQIKPHDFGVRETLADIGATISSFFNAPHPESGISLLST